MSFFQEFKAFALKGNVVDMAVGVIIGGAFGKIVSSAVSDLIMPPLGILIGGVDFANLAVTLKAATDSTPAVVLPYGHFIQAVVDFLIVALAIFLAIKAMTRLYKAEEEVVVAPGPSKQEELLGEIRDLLKQQSKE